jgi:peptidoglycan/LPS O-acetylase OafA/YrhL
MAIGLSLYLDLLRFLMAFTVMLGHASDPAFLDTSRLLRGFPRYGLTAVTGFFVLSGMVIAHVSTGSERDPRRYFVARASRLYSVVLPALALTALLALVGSHVDPHLYQDGPIHVRSEQPRRYLLTALLVQNFWIWPREMTPGVNHPFWTLSYEATYYLVFGLLLTRRVPIIVCGSALALALAGPKIAALMPIWFLGVATYYASKRFSVPRPLALILFIGSLVGICWLGGMRLDDDNIVRYDLDYGEALLFSCNLLSASVLAPWLATVLVARSEMVRYLGMLTFALYLCHRPLLYFFTALHLAQPGTWVQTAWLFTMTFLVVIAVAHLAEWARRSMRGRWLASVPRRSAAALPGDCGRDAPSAFGAGPK